MKFVELFEKTNKVEVGGIYKMTSGPEFKVTSKSGFIGEGNHIIITDFNDKKIYFYHYMPSDKSIYQSPKDMAYEMPITKLKKQFDYISRDSILSKKSPQQY